MSDAPDSETEGQTTRIMWLADQAAHILAAALFYRVQQLLDLLNETVTRYGAAGIYCVCCAMAEAVRRLGMPDVPRGDGTLTGSIVSLTSGPFGDDEPGDVWARQFISAYVNGDAAMTNALFYATVEDVERHQEDVICLIAMAAALARDSMAAPG